MSVALALLPDLSYNMSASKYWAQIISQEIIKMNDNIPQNISQETPQGEIK